MKYIILALVFLLNVSYTYSQWVEQSVPLSQALYGNYFFNGSTGFVVGEQGTILKTTNSGQLWSLVSSPTTNHLHKINFINATTGIIVGANGVIPRSTNSGTTWNSISTIYGGNNNRVTFVGGTTCYIANVSGVLKSTNYGLNWTRVYTSPSNIIYGVSFINQNTGIAVGDNSLIVRTSNAGLNWSFVTTGTSYLLDGIDVTADSCFYLGGGNVGGDGCVLKSVDSGLEWSVQHRPTIGRINQLHFANNLTGYASSLGGVFIKTTNAGLNWTNINIFNTVTDLWDCNPASGQTVIVTGSNGKIYRTDVGGTVTGIISNNTTPDNFSLYQNFPNPFNPTTNIKFDIAQNSKVSLKIYDVKGDEAATLIDKNMNSGSYTIDWDASKFNSGIYFYKLETSKGVLTKKMMLIK